MAALEGWAELLIWTPSRQGRQGDARRLTRGEIHVVVESSRCDLQSFMLVLLPFSPNFSLR